MSLTARPWERSPRIQLSPRAPGRPGPPKGTFAMDGRTSDFDTGFRRTSGGGAAALAEDRLGSNPRTASFRPCDSGQVISSAGTCYSTHEMGVLMPTPKGRGKE